MSQNEEHLNLLSILHYVLAGLTVLFSSIFLIHVGMGIAMLSGAFDGKDAPPKMIGWLFVLLGSGAVLCGWTMAVLMVIAGRKLRRRISRMFCLVIAAIECINMPLGTVLGVFTLILLSKGEVKQLFDTNEKNKGSGL